MILDKLKTDTNKSDQDLIKFSSILATKTNEGFVVLERNDKLPYAILIKNQKKVNHIYNLLIFCFTLGLWIIPWIYISQVSSKAKKILIAIDENGIPFEEKCF
ncbi:hypothetical protein RCH18_002472 [Flavobacterium sp. PL11]|jgi:hypothetical protein|uniref:hypothetical protein n=1 Tax=Flavobacterium sp. PL11 TaxID=3071717 RepID=UPI002E0AD7DA|nr:hypothetical protein [Flavobacterium sp. PL11]